MRKSKSGARQLNANRLLPDAQTLCADRRTGKHETSSGTKAESTELRCRVNAIFYHLLTFRQLGNDTFHNRWSLHSVPPCIQTCFCLSFSGKYKTGVHVGSHGVHRLGEVKSLGVVLVRELGKATRTLYLLFHKSRSIGRNQTSFVVCLLIFSHDDSKSKVGLLPDKWMLNYFVFLVAKDWPIDGHMIQTRPIITL